LINTPVIYSDSESQVSSDLTIPERRKPIWLNWFTALLTPQQWLNDLVFTKYHGGSTAPTWVSGNTYAYGDNALYLDNAVYECTNLSGVTSSTPPNQDTANWHKILDSFIGIAERIKYTGQKFYLEYLLNRYFQIGDVSLPWYGSQNWFNNLQYEPGQNVYYTDGNLYTCILAPTANQVPTDATYWTLNPQIYIIGNEVNIGDFWMGTESEGSPQPYMPIDSRFASSWMPINSSVYQDNSFTVYVPAAVAAQITANIVALIPGSLDTYVELITSILNNYIRGGKKFNVTTYP
jgi:hypothetical protein